MKFTSANTPLLATIKAQYNVPIYKHVLSLFNGEGQESAITYLQQFSINDVRPGLLAAAGIVEAEPESEDFHGVDRDAHLAASGTTPAVAGTFTPDWEWADNVIALAPALETFMVDDTDFDESTGTHVYCDEFGGYVTVSNDGTIDLSGWPEASAFYENEVNDFDEIDAGDPYDIEYDI